MKIWAFDLNYQELSLSLGDVGCINGFTTGLSKQRWPQQPQHWQSFTSFWLFFLFLNSFDELIYLAVDIFLSPYALSTNAFKDFSQP
jgi:hypothetical protein